MMRPTICFLTAALVALFADGVAQAEEKMLAHDVYFSLNDNSPEAKEKLVAACKKYLSDHPGTVWFAAGPLAEELKREVNDRDFDVALHLVFKSKAAHEQYAKAEKHLKFIEENKENWKKVRVFDSYVEAFAHGAVEGMSGTPSSTGKAGLPEAAIGFAGMIQGKVAHKQDGQFTLKIEKVLREWEHNKAKEARSLVGQTVLIQGQEGNVARFIKNLQVGEEVTLDVAQKNPFALTVMELTEDQRERVKE